MKTTKQLVTSVMLTGSIVLAFHFPAKAQTVFSGTSNGCLAGTLGTSRCFVGCNAGNSNTASGNYNSFFGDQSGKLSDNGSYNSFFGYSAGYSNAAYPSIVPRIASGLSII